MPLMPIISIRKRHIARVKALSTSLDLYVDNLLDGVVAQDLGYYGPADHPLSIRILGHALQVTGRHDQKSKHGHDGKHSEDGSREPAVRAGGFDLALKAKPLAD